MVVGHDGQCFALPARTEQRACEQSQSSGGLFVALLLISKQKLEIALQALAYSESMDSLGSPQLSSAIRFFQVLPFFGMGFPLGLVSQRDRVSALSLWPGPLCFRVRSRIAGSEEFPRFCMHRMISLGRIEMLGFARRRITNGFHLSFQEFPLNGALFHFEDCLHLFQEPMAR